MTSSATHDPGAWTIAKIVDWSTNHLAKSGSGSARLDVELMLSEVLGISRIQIYTQFERPVLIPEREKFKAFLKRRVAGEPVAYILGRKDFFGRTFSVSSDVLIPRLETEMIVEAVLDRFAEQDDHSTVKILDLGTGSGCLAITLSLELNGCLVEAWDISDQALALARKNADTLSAAVDFKLTDGLCPSNWQNAEKFDVIVCNPPYIARNETPQMSHSVLNYEPEMALFAEENGLRFYLDLSCLMKQRLKPGAWVFFEIGYQQGDAVKNIFIQQGWQNVKVEQDLSGHARMVAAQLS